MERQRLKDVVEFNIFDRLQLEAWTLEILIDDLAALLGDFACSESPAYRFPRRIGVLPTLQPSPMWQPNMCAPQSEAETRSATRLLSEAAHVARTSVPICNCATVRTGLLQSACRLPRRSRWHNGTITCGVKLLRPFSATEASVDFLAHVCVRVSVHVRKSCCCFRQRCKEK